MSEVIILFANGSVDVHSTIEAHEMSPNAIWLRHGYTIIHVERTSAAGRLPWYSFPRWIISPEGMVVIGHGDTGYEAEMNMITELGLETKENLLK